MVKREKARRKLIHIYTGRGAANERFLDDVHCYANLLLERVPGEYGFIHLTFQEYLAGVVVVQSGPQQIERVVASWASDRGHVKRYAALGWHFWLLRDFDFRLRVVVVPVSLTTTADWRGERMVGAEERAWLLQPSNRRIDRIPHRLSSTINWLLPSSAVVFGYQAAVSVADKHNSGLRGEPMVGSEERAWLIQPLNRRIDRILHQLPNTPNPFLPQSAVVFGSPL